MVTTTVAPPHDSIRGSRADFKFQLEPFQFYASYRISSLLPNSHIKTSDPMHRLPSSYNDFRTEVRSLHSTIRDPATWIILKLTLLTLTPLEHEEVLSEVKTLNLQVESLSSLMKACEDGVGDRQHLKKAIVSLLLSRCTSLG